MIENISIKNYKSIKNATIPLQKVNLIIGGNNAGKSNLLEAFEFYSRLFIMDLEEVFGPGPYSYRSSFFRGSNIKNESMELGIVYSSKEFNIQHVVEVDDYYNRGKFSIQIKNETINFNGESHTAENSTKMLLKSIWEDENVKSELHSYVKSCRSIRKFQFVPKSIKKERVIDPLDQYIPYLQPEGDNLINVLFSLRDKNNSVFEDILTKFKEIYPDVLGLSFKHLGESKYAIEFTRKIGNNKWSFIGPEISDGFVITLAIITLIHHPSSPNPIMIEEIENGLNPKTLEYIFKLIISSSEKDSLQYLITSHSPILLEHLRYNPECVLICEQIKGETKFYQLTEILNKFGDDYEFGESLFHLWFNNLIGGL